MGSGALVVEVEGRASISNHLVLESCTISACSGVSHYVVTGPLR